MKRGTNGNCATVEFGAFVLRYTVQSVCQLYGGALHGGRCNQAQPVKIHHFSRIIPHEYYET